jgi:hypothetical protein
MLLTLARLDHAAIQNPGRLLPGSARLVSAAGQELHIHLLQPPCVGSMSQQGGPAGALGRQGQQRRHQRGGVAQHPPACM